MDLFEVTLGEEDTRFERMGVFTYSLEPDTPAEKLPDHLPDDVKDARRDELMAVQQELAFAFGDSLVGYELDVMVDERIDDEFCLGRCFADAPEIDGAVYVTGSDLAIGQLVPCEIVACQDYDLIAAPVGEPR